MRDCQESVTTGQTDRRTDGRTDKIIPMCRYALQATQQMCLRNTNAPSRKQHSPKLAIFSINVMVKVTRSLTLVPFEMVSLVENVCQV